MKLKIIINSILILAAFHTYAQSDVQFSQYVFNGLSVNPAYAGYKEDWYVNGSYRKQWVSFPGAPQTGSVSIDGLTNDQNKNTGIGGQLMFDKLGPQQTISLFGSYSFRIRLDDADTKRLCLGIGVGLDQYSINGNDLQYVDANDPSIPVGNATAISPDARCGVYYYSPRFYIGASVLNMFSLYGNKIVYGNNGILFSSIKKNPTVYLTSGTLVDLSDEVKLKPSFMIKEDFHGPTSLDINLFALLSEKLWVGASYRTAVKLWNKDNLSSNLSSNGAVSALAELYVTENLRIGYSYDFLTSGIANYQAGTHEISVGILFPNKKNQERIKSPRYF